MKLIMVKEFSLHQFIPPPLSLASISCDIAQPICAPGDQNIHLFSDNFLNIYYKLGTITSILSITVRKTNKSLLTWGF